MKLLFVQGGTRVKRDTAGALYTDGNFNINVWKRYIDLAETMTVVFRGDSQKYSVEEAKEHLNPFDTARIKSIILPDMYRPKKNYISLSKRSLLNREIERAVKENDCIIIRSLGNIYVEAAIKYSRKYRKPYLVEATGVYWDNSWYHSFLGKVLAPFREHSAKVSIKNAPYAVYVTEEALQKRYPCMGVTLGCSDVELKKLEQEVLKSRIYKINNHKFCPLKN